MLQLLFTWDIGETPGIDLGFFIIRYYSLMWIFAFIIGFYIMKKVFDLEKVDHEYLDPFLMYSIIGCMMGARIGDCIFYNWEYFQDHLIEIVLPIRYELGETLFGFIPNYKFTGFAGLASHGATIGMIISTFLFHRKYPKLNLLWVFDRLVLTVPIGGAMIRLGNFFNSEIVGKPFDGALAVTFPHQSAGYGDIVPRHATQLYEAFGYLILFAAFYYVYFYTKKKNLGGWLLGLFFSALWIIRFTIEFFKEPQSNDEFANSLGLGLNNGQVLSIPFIILGFYLMWRAKPYNSPPVKD